MIVVAKTVVIVAVVGILVLLALNFFMPAQMGGHVSGVVLGKALPLFLVFGSLLVVGCALMIAFRAHS